MKIRRYTKEDIPDLVELLGQGLQLYHYSKARYDPSKIEHTLLGNVTNLTLFCNVIDVEGKVVGGMAGVVEQYPFSKDVYARDLVTYIIAEHRSYRSCRALVDSYIAWARQRRVLECRWSQSTGFKVEKFALLAKRFGFKQIGTHFNMEF